MLADAQTNMDISKATPTSQKRPYQPDIATEHNISPKYYRVDVHFPSNYSDNGALGSIPLDALPEEETRHVVTQHDILNTNGVPLNVQHIDSAAVQKAEPKIEDTNLNEDDEHESIMKMMSQHADHRGPREVGAVGDNMAMRYFRSRTWRDGEGTSNSHNTSSGAQNTSVNRHVAPIPIGADYVCHMCGEKGHHIKLCPKKQGRRQGKKVRSATGIPRSWLQLIDSDRTNEYENVYCLPNGQLAVLKPEAARGGTQSREARNVEAINDDLKCRLCHKFFTDATLVSCCGSTFCKGCITPLTTAMNTYCPTCGYFPFRMVDLEPNLAVQDSLSALQTTTTTPSLATHRRPSDDRNARSKNISNTMKSKEEAILQSMVPAKAENRRSRDSRRDESTYQSAVARQQESANRSTFSNSHPYDKARLAPMGAPVAAVPAHVLSYGKPFTASDTYRPPFSFGLPFASQNHGCIINSAGTEPHPHPPSSRIANEQQTQQQFTTDSTEQGTDNVELSPTAQPSVRPNSVVMHDSACVHDDDNKPKSDSTGNGDGDVQGHISATGGLKS